MEKGKEYYAFISYKREDEKWAKWLQDKLEHYKFPTNLNGRTDLPKSIRPTFRDVTDLKPGLLAEEINNALSNSEWLIVVCSPRSAKSQWVCKEAQTFIDLGRADHIIPFVIEGNPFSNNIATECYPEALLNLTGSKELLAANINEMGRDAAAIKVVARMFNLRFDALWQRYEREQRRKKWMWIGGAIIFALSGLSIGGYFVKQNNTIEKQNVKLQKYISTLIEANNTFSSLNSEKKTYYLAGELRGNGCQDLSLMSFDYHPYEPIVAFSDDWGFWLHYLNSGIEIQLPTGCISESVRDVSALCFSNDGTELMAESSAGVFIWNVESHDLIRHFMPDEFYTESERFSLKFPNYNNDSISDKGDEEQLKTYNYSCKIECSDGLIKIIDKEKNTSICSTDLEMGEDSIYRCLFNPQHKEILFITDKRAALYNDYAKRFVLFFKGYHNAYDLDFSSKGEYLRIENRIYERTVMIDTIRNLKYDVGDIYKFPNSINGENKQYVETNKATIEVVDQSIKYRRGNFTKIIEVVKQYSTGNVQEYLSDALFAGPNKIVAIVEQGRFRVYNTISWTLVGTLDNYVWTDDWNMSMGHEEELSHACSFIASAKYINRKLYVLSSGGIVRIYNTDKYCLERVVELPINRKKGESFFLPIEKSYFADDGSKVYYSFEEEPFFYVCELPIMKK